MGLPSTRDPYYPNLPPYGPPPDPYQYQYPGYIDATPRPQPQPRPKYWLHIGLFLLTIASTTLVAGWQFSASLMAILTAHEFGHFFAARSYRVQASLPYFIPLPLPPLGTMGALIRMSSRIPSRRALFDIAAAGPLAGLIFAIPASLIGIALSTTISKESIPQGSWIFGEPLLFKAMIWLVKGPMPEDMDLMLHPLGYAGWAGLFVTAFNLLPMGQLDGGHVCHSFSEKVSKIVAQGFFAILAIFSLIYQEPQWVLLLLLLLIFGVRHPRMYDDDRPLGTGRIAIGVLLAFIFVTCFTFTPISIIE